MSHWFHLTPADLDAMSAEELGVYVDAVQQIRKEQS